MNLYKQILINTIGKEEINILFPNTIRSAAKIVETHCYESLQKIKTIIEDDSLSDKECFNKIEEIVCVFEKLGSNCGTRHDF